MEILTDYYVEAKQGESLIGSYSLLELGEKTVTLLVFNGEKWEAKIYPKSKFNIYKLIK